MFKIIATALLLFSFQAHADIQVSCNDGDCLSQGWTVFNNGIITQEIECVDGDCRQHGWELFDYAGGDDLTVLCHDGDCFENGWDEERNNGYLVRQAYCSDSRSSDRRRSSVDDSSDENIPRCFTNGWQVQERYNQYNIRCLRGDCTRYGWLTTGPNTYSRMSCRQGSCFTEGWVNW